MFFWAEQRRRIWAWDCVLNEPILVLPSVLALLGANPMQMKGRDVAEERGSGYAAADDAASVASEESTGAASSFAPLGQESEGGVAGYPSDGGSDGASSAPDEPVGKDKKRGWAKRALESMADMASRVSAFLKLGTLRNKHETAEKLQSYFTLAAVPGTKTKIRDERTNTGIKDTPQLAHLENLFRSYKNKRGYTAKQAALSTAMAELPDTTINPIWRIQELDAHQDTPVEVLHVVLLGFVKYFWRHLVQGQLKNKNTLKDLLATHLSSLDVTGLGISPLAGKTLVQYAGSLTGRDFRVITQVAPFVIYDMVSDECYKAWVALACLVPLIWQPHIDNVAEHLALLKKEINYFLLSTATGLFATEAFELFNAVIRMKSVHSNHQAPSRDIARAFAQSNRICHLLSGRYFMHEDTLPPNLPSNTDELGTSTPACVPFSFDCSRWRTVGAGPLSLVPDHSTVTRYLGFPTTSLHRGKRVILVHGPREKRSCSPISVWGSSSQIWWSRMARGTSKFVRMSFSPMVTSSFGQTFIGHIDEILTPLGSIFNLNRQADRVLLQVAHKSCPAGEYGMPYVVLQAQRALVPVQVHQKRVLTSQMKAVVVHQKPTDGVILNIAQMRNARHLQRHCPRAPVLDAGHVVMTGVAKEVDLQKCSPAQPADSFDMTSNGRAAAINGHNSRGSGHGGRGARKGHRSAREGQMVHGGRGGMRGGDMRSHLPSIA
ncbi:hypothetical protein C8Q73DRAFT_669148 [Cubamyces lactineus]|nr:hypothetical protein C8Q73DRAFT_669148 [Cubamyces lactineus]